MSAEVFWPLYAVLLATMLVCRCVPMLVLGNRSLSARVSRALEMIPSAAFAALVANDLCRPDLWAQGAWTGAVPVLSAAVVAVCALRTRSLAVCALAGVAAYVALVSLPL